MIYARATKRAVALFFCVVFAFCLPGCGTSESVSVRCDGLYCLIRDVDGDGLMENRVLCFYNDGTVVGVTVGETSDGYFPRETWFGNDTCSKGNYVLTNQEISFTTTSTEGSVEYWGTVQENKLVLNLHSYINDNEVTGQEYIFYPFDEIPGWYGDSVLASDDVESTGSAEDNSFGGVESQGVASIAPHHELSFSVEDFSYAGYSVAEGDHINEVYKTVSETFISSHNSYQADHDWLYSPEISYPGTVAAFFYRGYGTTLNNSAAVSYIVDDQEWIYNAYHTVVSLRISYDASYVGEQIVDSYPLLVSPVIPEMSWDEVLERLKLTDIVNAATACSDSDGDYLFESQYGKTHCRLNSIFYSNVPNAKTIAITYMNRSITLSFKNDVLFDVECSVTYT